MLIARVVGDVVATQKVDGIVGHKLLVLQPSSVNGDAKGDSFVVATDAVGAGVGELVLYCQGSSARLTEITEGKPVDAVIVAIIDSVTQQGREVFRK